MTEYNGSSYCTYNENLPKENKFEFQDIVRYKGENKQYYGCEGMVVEQNYHRCYRDYETKVIMKLQGGYQQEVWMWGSSLEKVDHTKHQGR